MPKNIRFKVLVVALFTVIASTQPIGARARQAFSSTLGRPLSQYDLHSDRALVQKFSGLFVKALGRTVSDGNIQSCLRSLGATDILVHTYNSGSVAVSGSTCAARLTARSASNSGIATDQASIAANRILAMTLVANQFDSDPFYRLNDRDLAHYDVEIYSKSGDIWVDIQPVHPQVTVAGCPSTGPTYALYIVNGQTFSVRPGHTVC